MINMSKQTKSSLLYLALLFLGGFCHVMDNLADHYFISTWLFCADLMLYFGLILHWVQSVRRRLLPSPARTDMIASGLLMEFFLFVRTVSYRIVQWSPPLERYCWYIYYIPIILVPTLFLMSSFYFGNRSGQHNRLKHWPLVFGLVLAFGILTNDLHHLAFRPNPGTIKFIGKSGTYTHEALYYAAYIWAGGMFTAGIVHLIVVSRKMRNWKKAIRPFLCLLLIPLLTSINKILVAADLPEPFLMPEIMIFCMIGVQEYCIQNRLLPHNENYSDFFSGIELPVSITDKNLKQVFQTALSVTAAHEQMQQAVGSFVYPDPDTRLSGMELEVGYAFFAEDESVLHKLNEELAEANEILSMENELLVRERELTEEKAAIEERSALYTRAAREVYSAQKRISEMLEQMQPDTPSFRKEMVRILVITAFVKRKANFVMLEADQGAITAVELSAAMKESFHYLDYCGIHTAARITASRDFSCRNAMAVYDCFEAVAEALYGKTEELWLRLTDEELTVMADTDEPLMLPELPLPASCIHEDGQTVLRVQIGGDEA